MSLTDPDAGNRKIGSSLSTLRVRCRPGPDPRLGKGTGTPDYRTLVPALVTYGIAAVLLASYIVQAVAARETLADGVTTTATGTSAGINGMVNYVQHRKLTLKFTDQHGKERWFHPGRTGMGYSVGQEFQIKYDPNKRGSRRGIVVVNG